MEFLRCLYVCMNACTQIVNINCLYVYLFSGENEKIVPVKCGRFVEHFPSFLSGAKFLKGNRKLLATINAFRK